MDSQKSSRLITYKNFATLNNEKEKREAELTIANKKLVVQHQEKEKLAAELAVSNKELIFQNNEKEKRAAELLIANEELISQNDRKEKRAAELVLANLELIVQNTDKESRAAELVIANKELIFQNDEKEKRAAELVVANTELAIANKELAFQYEEKERITIELSLANKELFLQNEEKIHKGLELELAVKELDSFSYSVSHDLRAPLRAINGFTCVLKDEYDAALDDDAKNLLNEIIANSTKMGQLIDNLLDFSRLGKQQPSMVNLNIEEIVNSVIIELKQLEPNRTFAIEIKNLVNIKGDKNMIKQAFINLISNAFKYTGKKEKAGIEIGSFFEEDNNFRTYYVKDNGAGFDMKYYNNLFGVFQRLHSSNEFEGTGVGLAIIQKIISKHNGKVWAEGKVNEGACFYISLPVLENTSINK
jgi:signal transduction histidine kinase